MTLEQIRSQLQAWDECRIINRTADNGQLAAAALTRRGKTVTLWLVRHDETYLEMLNEAELQAIHHSHVSHPTNRERLLNNNSALKSRIPIENLRAILLGKQEYPITSASQGQVHSDNLNIILAISELLREGWEPGEMAQINMESLFLSEHELRGEFEALPPEDTLTLLPNEIQDEEMIPIDCTLSFDTNNVQPHTLDIPNGKYAWIVGTEWFDPWKHLEETLSHPKIKEQFTAEELEQRRSEIEKCYSKFCPRGNAMPVVVYESEQDISLYFYDNCWLDKQSVMSGSTFAVLGLHKGEDRIGPHGLPLHAATLTELALDCKTTRKLSLGMMRLIRHYPQPPVVMDDIYKKYDD